ncbi:MAG: polyketide synthase [SAR324 cluster bacterium]|uniref:Polyketide synthase n=1 Tax=SAR324 cluster bacterium TaxID=2024889 RepID=A0A2A4ST86_9DELT|nr:MAG: polyketide synthase [SAR324 cluster bacterium]
MSNLISEELDLEAEAVLDPSIQFERDAANTRPPKAIFLTGATGLLGAYLLQSLLQQTNADIYCLIRSDSPDSGKQRLQRHLKSYSIWTDSFNSRIFPIIGDLAKPLFGLSTQEFDQLSQTIDLIYHNGAQISFIRPYKALKATNVLGTHEIIRLAGLNKTKPVHFISTLAVFFNQSSTTANALISETEIPKYDAGLKGGYKQSKWVAEELIRLAQERGLPACIYRPVRISGHSQTGITQNFDDFFFRLLKGCIHLKQFPRLDIAITLLPVDYVCEAVIQLSLRKAPFGRAFNLLNPTPMPWKSFIKIFMSWGYELQEVNLDDWMCSLQEYSRKYPQDQFLKLLYFFMRKPSNLLAKKPKVETTQTLQELEALGVFCPEINEKLLSSYISYFQAIDYFPHP